MAPKGFYDDKCRCCLQNGTLKNMWDEKCDGGEEIYGELMNKCFAVSWQKHEVEIEKICESCIGRLQDAVDFKKMILTSEHILLEYEELNEEAENTNEQPKDSEMVLFDMETHEMQDDIYMEEEYLDENDTVVRNEIGCTETKQKIGNVGKYRDVTCSDSDEILDDDKNKLKPGAPQIRSEERKKLQDNLRAILLSSNATPLKLPTDKGYGCGFCNLAFREPTNLKRHIYATHGDDVKSKYMMDVEMNSFIARMDITDLYCKYCYENIDSIEHLLEHLQNVHNEKVHTNIMRLFIPFKFHNSDLKCCQCDGQFQTFRALSRHMATHYRNYQCKICCNWYINRMLLGRHRRIHNTGVYSCSKRPKIFDNNINRKQHEFSIHFKKHLKSPCGLCNERFADSRTKQRHLTVVHGVNKHTLLCNACQNKFSSTKSLIRHIRSVHLKMAVYICDICGKGHSEKRALRYHIAGHMNTKAFACLVCNRRFNVERGLNSHMKVHQKNDSIRFDEFIYTCDFCQRKFSRRKTMLRHMRTVHNFWDRKNT